MMVFVPPQAKGKKGKTRGIPSWLFFPPTLLLPIVALFYAIGQPFGRAQLPLAFIVFFSMVYIALSLAYSILAAKGNRKGAHVVALLANGALVIFLNNLMAGPGSLNWLGAILFLLGLIYSMNLLSPPPSPRFSKEDEMILPMGTDRGVARHILDAITFPAAFLELGGDGAERVITSNKPFATMLGRSVEKTEGVLFSSLIPSHNEGSTLRFLDAEWLVRRATKGRQTLFMLSPREKVAEPPIVQVLDAIDPDTGLFTRKFLDYKGKSDVEGCCRYKRRLAVSLLRLAFGPQNGIPLADETRTDAFKAFARMVAETIRDCDSGYRVGDEEILIFLPDTTPQGAVTAVARIRSRMRKLAAMEFTALASATMNEGTVNFFGKDAQSLDHVIEEAYLAIGRGEDLKDTRN